MKISHQQYSPLIYGLNKVRRKNSNLGEMFTPRHVFLEDNKYGLVGVRWNTSVLGSIAISLATLTAIEPIKYCVAIKDFDLKGTLSVYDINTPNGRQDVNKEIIDNYLSLDKTEEQNKNSSPIVNRMGMNKVSENDIEQLTSLVYRIAKIKN